MALFEYITVAVSIVLSLSIVRSLEAFGDVLRPDRRYAVHTTWFALKAFQPALLWWSIWRLHDVETWNFVAFLLCLASPAFLFLQVNTLVGRHPETVEDWRKHFYANRARFFGANIGLAFVGPMLLLVLGSVDETVVLGIAMLFEISMSILAIRSTAHRVHVGVVSVTSFAFACWAILLFEPFGPLSP
jgi:hypothetical protein